ncbi:hypothetical protein K493DRAFT_316457 [Basidiobolus meristosporus CBS 931.73]|uniref:Uncharacterized protein n=1 Tax=Basidiobolus meristosporus CBS 931.73 TaxID=1314790 RepID=A0A1Y1Y3T8_9FUNG|nr:hypothetical protein K493DRAFT_316457 [Basidiobolus meristosporus CBS 931.73]|eukprot:ORX92658.1 hypothetical protein K493DRAFT_316457 [Basidiobolus meristosporus CBS 931.73]
MLVVQSLPIAPSMPLTSSHSNCSEFRAVALSPLTTPYSTGLSSKSEMSDALPLDREIPSYVLRRRNAVVEATYGEPFVSRPAN